MIDIATVKDDFCTGCSFSHLTLQHLLFQQLSSLIFSQHHSLFQNQIFLSELCIMEGACNLIRNLWNDGEEDPNPKQQSLPHEEDRSEERREGKECRL